MSRHTWTLEGNATVLSDYWYALMTMTMMLTLRSITDFICLLTILIFPNAVICFYSNAAACAKQRLSDTEKVKLRDADDDDDVNEASCAVMHTTLTLLLRYQRLLLSQFITADKLRKMDTVVSPSGTTASSLCVVLL